VINAESFVGTDYEHLQEDAISEQAEEEYERKKAIQRNKQQREDELDVISPQIKWEIIWALIIMTTLFVALGLYIKSNNFSSKGPSDMDKRAEIRMRNIMGQDVDVIEEENAEENNDTVDKPMPAIVHESIMNDDFHEMRLGVYYVVSASFKKEERVRKYMDEHGGDVKLLVYRYGQRYIISPFNSHSRKECERFILNNKMYADCWIATKKEGVP